MHQTSHTRAACAACTIAFHQFLVSSFHAAAAAAAPVAAAATGACGPAAAAGMAMQGPIYSGIGPPDRAPKGLMAAGAMKEVLLEARQGRVEWPGAASACGDLLVTDLPPRLLLLPDRLGGRAWAMGLLQLLLPLALLPPDRTPRMTTLLPMSAAALASIETSESGLDTEPKPENGNDMARLECAGEARSCGEL